MGLGLFLEALLMSRCIWLMWFHPVQLPVCGPMGNPVSNPNDVFSLCKTNNRYLRAIYHSFNTEYILQVSQIITRMKVSKIGIN